MQRLFANDTPWKTPWMARVTPVIETLASAYPDDIVFTRFIPLPDASAGSGTWKRYYERWSSLTLSALDPDLLNLVAPLANYVPPSPVFDKRVYRPWHDGKLHQMLQGAGKDTLVVTGAETEVCVAATVFGAIDLGHRVIVATDAICGSADATHDAQEILDVWRE